MIAVKNEYISVNNDLIQLQIGNVMYVQYFCRFCKEHNLPCFDDKIGDFTLECNANNTGVDTFALSTGMYDGVVPITATATAVVDNTAEKLTTTETTVSDVKNSTRKGPKSALKNSNSSIQLLTAITATTDVDAQNNASSTQINNNKTDKENDTHKHKHKQEITILSAQETQTIKLRKMLRFFQNRINKLNALTLENVNKAKEINELR